MNELYFSSKQNLNGFTVVEWKSYLNISIYVKQGKCTKFIIHLLKSYWDKNLKYLLTFIICALNLQILSDLN